MARKRRTKFLLPEEVILGAIDHNSEACEIVLAHYDRFIRRLLYDNLHARRIEVSDAPIEDMVQEIKLALMEAIFNFHI